MMLSHAIEYFTRETRSLACISIACVIKVMQHFGRQCCNTLAKVLHFRPKCNTLGKVLQLYQS